MRKRALRYLMLCFLGLVAIGCNSTDTDSPQPVPQFLPTPFPGYTFPLVDLTNRIIPLPNNFVLDPATGRVNLPGGTGTGDSTINAANSLDGFSTTGPIVIPFRGTLVPGSVNQQTLPVYNSATGQPVQATYSVDNTGNPTGSVVIVVPARPLDPATTYVVVLTQGLTSALSNSPILSDNVINFIQQPTPLVDGQGNSTTRLLTNEQANQLEPVRQGNQAVIGAAEQLTGTTRTSIPFAFAFTTQTLFQALPVARTRVLADNNGLVNSFGTNPVAAGQGAGDGNPANGNTVDEFFVSQLGPSLGAQQAAQVPNDGIGSVWVGTLNVPQFRASQSTDWWANPPVKGSDRPVQFLLCMPDQTNPAFAGPRPVVIFQHGIARNKGVLLLLANAFTSNGVAVIGIDMPLHGSLKDDPAAADGTGFINPAAPRVTRDNVRQGVVGLYALNNAIFRGLTDLNGNGVPELAPGTAPAPFNRPFFLGTSLGAMVGTVYTATEPNANRAVLNVPGGRVTFLLLNSPTFGPPLLAGLANAGIQPGTSDFARFGIFTQAVIDDVDPLNYAEPAISGALRGGEPANLLQQVALSDTVILPEAQFDLMRAFGENANFAQVAAVQPLPGVTQEAAPTAGPGGFEVIGAEHGGLLSPAQGPTTQIVTQAIVFLLGNPQLQVPAGTIISTGLRTQTALGEAANPEDYRHAIGF